MINRLYRTSLDIKIPDINHAAEICGLINSHAPILYKMAGGIEGPDKIQISCDLISEMLACATESFQCQLLKNYYPDATFVAKDKTYPSVFLFSPQLKTYPFFLSTMMKIGTGIITNDCKKDSDCEPGFECLGKCVKSMTKQHSAYGTGLKYDLATARFSVVDESKGTWVESRWDSQGMRIFKIQSWKSDLIFVAIGLSITAASICLNWKFDVLNWFDSIAKKSA